MLFKTYIYTVYVKSQYRCGLVADYLKKNKKSCNGQKSIGNKSPVSTVCVAIIVFYCAFLLTLRAVQVLPAS